MTESIQTHKNDPRTRIAFAASYTKSILKFRGSLVSLFLDRGYHVIFMAPFLPVDDIGAKLEKLGVETLSVRLQRKSLNIFGEIITILSFIRSVGSRDIDILVPYTLKPVIYGGIAVLINKQLGRRDVVLIPMITGLGFLFSPLAEQSIRSIILKKIVISLYRLSLRACAAVIFQNHDDMMLFQKSRLISRDQPTLVVNGSGVNLQEYPYSQISSSLSFTFVGRLLRSKGILHFLEVASLMAESNPEIIFNVVGGTDDSCDSVNQKDLDQFNHLRNVVFWGHLENPLPVVNGSTCVVLPSVYREGVPRSLLEALSIGRLIITTNTPGCKLTCHHKKNGYLLNTCDSISLMRSVRYISSLGTAKLDEMSRYSRNLAETYFDDRVVNNQIYDFIKTMQQEV